MVLDPGGVNVDAEVWKRGPTFMESDRAIARYLGRPVAEFLRAEAASGVLLLLAAVAAMWWANSQWSASYEALWETRVGLSAGSFSMVRDLQAWINDGAMVVFFFVVGLEIKCEIVAGHLRDPASWLAVKTGVDRLPWDTTWAMILGLGMVGGVGFRVALFITGLSFPESEQFTADAKAGILAASILAGLGGALFLLFATRVSARQEQLVASTPMSEECS